MVLIAIYALHVGHPGLLSKGKSFCTAESPDLQEEIKP